MEGKEDRYHNCSPWWPSSLLGGGVTALFSSEGNMVIAEGETSNHVDDYFDMELAFVNTSRDDSLEYTVFDAPFE